MKATGLPHALVFSGFAMAARAAAGLPVTTESLAGEMIDRNEVASLQARFLPPEGGGIKPFDPRKPSRCLSSLPNP